MLYVAWILSALTFVLFFAVVSIIYDSISDFISVKLRRVFIFITVVLCIVGAVFVVLSPFEYTYTYEEINIKEISGTMMYYVLYSENNIKLLSMDIYGMDINECVGNPMIEYSNRVAWENTSYEIVYFLTPKVNSLYLPKDFI